jgi:hypothetical protein
VPALGALPGFGPGYATDGTTGLATAGGAAVAAGGSDATPVCACAANPTPAIIPKLSNVDLFRSAIDASYAFLFNSGAVAQLSVRAEA